MDKHSAMEPLDKTTIKESHDEKAKAYLDKIDKLLLSDSDEDFPDIECETCNRKFSSVQMFEQHLNSKKHYQQLTKFKILQKLGKVASKSAAADKKEDDPLNSDSTEDLYCDVCNKEISGYISYMAHMKGSIHAKNLKQQKMKEEVKGMKEFLLDGNLDDESDEDRILQKAFARCAPCQKTFYGPEAYQQHMTGVNHKKKLRHLKVLESLKKDEKTENEIDDDETFSKCEVCNKTFSGPVPYKIHLKSSVHEKELKRVEAEEELKDFILKDPTGTKFVCKECKKTFSDPFSFKSHLANNSHGKQKVKDEMFDFVAANSDIVAVKSVQNISSDEEDEEKESFQNGQYFLVCKLCHMSFSGPESAKDHLKSKKHVKTKKEKAEKKILKEKLKEKQNGRSLENRKDMEVDPSDLKTDRFSNGDKTDSLPDKKSENTLHASKIQDDFEFI